MNGMPARSRSALIAVGAWVALVLAISSVTAATAAQGPKGSRALLGGGVVVDHYWSTAWSSPVGNMYMIPPTAVGPRCCSQRMPYTGIVRKLGATINVPIPAGGAVSITLVVNGQETAVSCTIPPGAQSCVSSQAAYVLEGASAAFTLRKTGGLGADPSTNDETWLLMWSAEYSTS